MGDLPKKYKAVVYDKPGDVRKMTLLESRHEYNTNEP